MATEGTRISIPAPPLKPLSARTRQIAFDELTSLKRDFFGFAFPGFFDTTPPVEPKSFDSAAPSKGQDPKTRILENLVQFKNSRRYAGDLLTIFGSHPSDLPRRSYHALTGPDGTDRGLLRNELFAYANFEATGGFMLIDALLESERNQMNYPERNAIVVQLGQNAQVKFLEKVAGNAASQRSRFSLATSLEGKFSDFSAERVLDLRQPDARFWFYNAFSDFTRLSGPLDPMLVEALAHERPNGPSFEYMLPTLCSTPRGGGWQSQVIGIVMRRLGVDALVFPSARCDPEVEFKDGRMVFWRGWNVVDYRGAPPPVDLEESGVLIASAALLGPEGLNAPYRGRKLEGSCAKKAMFLAGPFWTDISRAVMKIGMYNEGPYSGSLTVDGLDEAIEAAWFKAFTGTTLQKPDH